MQSIVSSDYQKGGTWSGAVEALQADWYPVFVRSDANVATGNKQLIKKGAFRSPTLSLAARKILSNGWGRELGCEWNSQSCFRH